MTDTAAPETSTSTPEPSPVDWSKVQRWGLYGGITLSFIAAIGMVSTLDQRTIIEGWLSLGFVSVAWVPLAFGYIAASEPIADGGMVPAKGERDLIAGMVTGALSGLFFSFFIVIVERFDLTSIFPKLLPQLIELLTFGRGLALSAVIWIVAGGLLGLLGGALHVFAPRVRRMLGFAIAGVLIVAEGPRTETLSITSG